MSAPNPMSSASGNCRLMGVNWRVFCALMNTMDDETGSVGQGRDGQAGQRMNEGVFNWHLVPCETPNIYLSVESHKEFERENFFS